MGDAALELKSKQVKVLDESLQAKLGSIDNNIKKHRFWQNVALASLLVLAVASFGYQDYLFQQQKKHTDCIVKLLATPSRAGQTRRIADLSTCQIKVSP